ncbi:MAG: zinc-binding dehydrogenase [Firmicutes bacterium]|nr:zinc-binding dehydrogenase [Bacillota bacterium]
MKALVWTAPHKMEWKEVPDVERPVEGWVRGVSVAVGICGSEVSAYLGHNELRRPPLVMGHEFSMRLMEDVPERGLNEGDLITVNPLVTCGQCRACRAGQRQLCRQRRIIGIDFPGSFGEQLWVPASQCYKVTDEVYGSLVEPLACAVRAGSQAGVQLGDAVMVIGAGIIGLMSAWVARERGASRVIVTDTNETRLVQAADWGATDTVNAKSRDVDEWVAETFPEGVDAVIDAVGFESTRQTSLRVVRRGGRVVWIGLHENASQVPGNQVVRDEIEVVGSFCYTDEEFSRAVALVNAGSLPADGRWLDVREMAQGPDAFREQAEGPAPFAKIVLTHGRLR